MHSTLLRSALFSTAFFGLWTNQCFAVGTEPAAATPAHDPASSSHDHDKMKEMIVLSVGKSQLRAELKTLPENGAEPKPLRSFKIAIGKVDGDKEREGDNKTPEGIYFTVGKIEGKQLAPEKYGPLALPLNFPNPMDQIGGKTGYGIWLHGVGQRKIEDANVTQGCVAFPNDEITSLVSWLKPSHGVVVIAKDLSDVNRPTDTADLYKTALDWVSAWSARDLDKYISYYAQDFQNNGKNVKAYRSYKQSVFKSYKEMMVKMSNVRIVTHPKYGLVMMNQDFRGDGRFTSDGRKMLYWRRDEGGQWKIVREMFDNFLMNPVQFSNDDVAGLKQGASLNQQKPAASTAGATTRSL